MKIELLDMWIHYIGYLQTLGYVPINNTEKLYASFSMLLASTVFGNTMNKIGSIFESINISEIEIQ